MFKYLLFILLKTNAIILVSGLLLLYIFLESQPVDINRMRCDMSGIAYVLFAAHVIFMSVLSALCFLNLKKIIRQKFWYSFLSFFGLHILNIINFLIIGPLRSSQEPLLFLIISMPYLCLLYYYFIRFRKKYALLEDDANTSLEN